MIKGGSRGMQEGATAPPPLPQTGNVQLFLLLSMFLWDEAHLAPPKTIQLDLSLNDINVY